MKLLSNLKFISFYFIEVKWIQWIYVSLCSCIFPTSHPLFQTIQDTLNTNQIEVIGFASLLFLNLFFKNHDDFSGLKQAIFSAKKIEHSFIPHFLKGIFISSFFILIFLLSGNYQYFGYWNHFFATPSEWLRIFLRIAALILMIYTESLLFYAQLPVLFASHLSTPLTAIFIAFVFCVMKNLQFHLTAMEQISLFLLSCNLFYRSRPFSQFTKSTGFWAGIFILFHVFFSFPLFGHEFNGIVFIQITSSPLFKKLSPQVLQLLTGGSNGPFSSLLFQLILLLDLIIYILKKKKMR